MNKREIFQNEAKEEVLQEEESNRNNEMKKGKYRINRKKYFWVRKDKKEERYWGEGERGEDRLLPTRLLLGLIVL
jgi:hypothetical protein